MFHAELLFENAFCNAYLGKIKLLNKQILYKRNRKENIFDLKDVSRIIGFIKGVEEQKSFKHIPLIFDIGAIQFADKLTYIILETVCYYVLKNTGRKIRFKLGCDISIDTQGFMFSPIPRFLRNEKLNVDEYLKKFELSIENKHYRRLISVDDDKSEFFCSKIMQDIEWFLTNCQITKDCREKISEVVVELIDNALEHSQSDCLIDLDISEDYEKIVNDEVQDTNNSYYGVNIVLLNLSPILLGEKLKDKMNSVSHYGGRYSTLLKAKKSHSMLWNNDYTEDDFYILSSFQYKVSSRIDSAVTGGTGLTKLLKSLEEQSDAYKCYVISGNRAMFFQHDYISFDSDEWIGFNKENDFVNAIPEKECFEKSDLFIPGTAYNLNFILQREDDLDAKN